MSIKIDISPSNLELYSTNNSKKLNKINLLNLHRKQMQEFFVSLGEQSFRANQVIKWIYKKFCNDFSSMTDINKKLRDKLAKISEIKTPIIFQQISSNDGTIKWLFAIGDDIIETVYIPNNTRSTLCISSQIGCIINCTFCATGKQGFNRNLTVSEIIGQIWIVSKIIQKDSTRRLLPITNIVIMGMGEPLLNFNNVVSAINIMLDNCCFGFSKRRVTLSTSGIVPALDQLKKNMIDISLAISLHAPNDELRDKIVPINKKYKIQCLIQSVKKYIKKSHANQGKVTIEYIMIDDINDHDDHAYQLINLLKDLPSKINLIPYNKIFNVSYNPSTKDRISRFANILIKNGFTTIVRKNRGKDINAACGQLVGKITDRTNR